MYLFNFEGESVNFVVHVKDYIWFLLQTLYDTIRIFKRQFFNAAQEKSAIIPVHRIIKNAVFSICLQDVES